MLFGAYDKAIEKEYYIAVLYLNHDLSSPCHRSQLLTSATCNITHVSHIYTSITYIWYICSVLGSVKGLVTSTLLVLNNTILIETLLCCCRVIGHHRLVSRICDMTPVPKFETSCMTCINCSMFLSGDAVVILDVISRERLLYVLISSSLL